jgi:hypothetical protein
MRLHRLWLVVLSTAVLAGCGGSSSSSGGGADPAQAVPAGVPVYIEGAVRPEGDQGDAARALIEKFMPPGKTLEGLVDDQLKQYDVTYKDDIKPWLGERVGFGVTNFTASEPTVYGALAITDSDKPAQLLAKDSKKKGDYHGAQLFQNGDAAIAVTDDYMLVANTEADLRKAIDAADGDSLGDSSKFKDAVDELPDADARLGALYLDLRSFVDIARAAPGMDPAASAMIEKLYGGLKQPVTSALTATSSSATVQTRVPGGGLGPLGLFGAESTDLIKDAPADAFAVLGVPNVGSSLKDAVNTFAGALGGAAITGKVEAETGVNLDRDVFSWVGDLAVYVRGDSMSTLNGALVIKASDEKAAAAAIPKLVAAAKNNGAPVEKATVKGADQAYAVPAPGAPGPVVLAEGNGRVALAFGEDAAGEALSPSGDTFGGSPTYARAKDSIDGLEPSLVLSLPMVFKLLEESGAATGDPDYAKAKPYLDKLDLVVTGGEKDGDTLRSLFTVTTR